MEDRPRFQYHALDRPSNQIRLLRIQPDEQKDDIASTIETHELESAPQYMALSYMWGSEKSMRHLTVNGRLFHIRQNAWSALQQFRQHFSSVCPVWIDSICINQDDLDEKAAQVSMMGSIYEQARGMLACLAESTIVDPVLLTACQKLDETHMAAVKSFDWKSLPASGRASNQTGAKVNTDWTELSELGTACLQTMSASEKTALKHTVLSLVNDRYWTRAWIVQEWLLSANPTILVGPHMIQWRSFFAIFLATSFTISDILPGLRTDRPAREEGTPKDLFLQIVTEMCLSKRKSTLQVIGTKFKMSQCSDVRDHIYAFLAVIEWCNLPYAVVPDYRINNFDLAVKVVPEVLVHERSPGELIVPPNALLHVEALLQLLEVDANDRVVKEKVEFRQASSGRTSTSLSKPVSAKLDTWAFNVQRTTRLVLGPDGDLQLSLKMAEGREVSPIKGRDTFDFHLDSYLAARGIDRENYPPLLTHGADIVGLLCRDVRDDDLLVEISKPSQPLKADLPYTTLCLVLREESESRFCIIGQAILRNELDRCTTCAQCSFMSRSLCVPQGTELSVALSLEDLIVWLAQDIVPDGDERFEYYARRPDIAVCGEDGSSFAYLISS